MNEWLKFEKNGAIGTLKLNRPDIIYDIPKMLFTSYGPLALKWNYIPKMLPWILKYLKSSTKNPFVKPDGLFLTFDASRV